LPGCGGSAPCGLAAHDVSLQPDYQAARANCLLAILGFAPFNESEQLGSHARPPKLMSKPVSPVGRVSWQSTGPLTDSPGEICCPVHAGRAWSSREPGCRGSQSIPLRWRPSAFAMSRAASRSAMAWR
jgi:hypothetical protein